MYKLFLMFRYVRGRLLSLVAVVVLAFAIAALVLAPSIMSGFQIEFHKRLRGTLSDLQVWSSQPHGLREDPKVEEYLGSLPHVSAVAPYIENPALDKHLNKIDYCFLRGIEPEKEAKVSRFREYLISDREAYLESESYEQQSDEEQSLLNEIAASLPGEPQVDAVFEQLVKGHPEDPDLPTVAVGVYYLKFWRLQVGDIVRLTSASKEGEVSQDKRFRIVGAFRTGHHDTDRRILVMSLPALQAFIDVPGRVTGYSLRMDDYVNAPLAKQQLTKDIRSGLAPLERGGYHIKTWEERNQNLLKAVAMEKLLIRLITGLVVFAASASIFLVLFMSVHTKVRELGILRAVGATRSGVLSLFVAQGFLIALLSMLLGLLIGCFLSVYINEIADLIHQTTGWHPFPPDVYYLDRIPTRIDPAENAVNFSATLALGGVAAFVPGLIAALKPPLKAIRYE